MHIKKKILFLIYFLILFLIIFIFQGNIKITKVKALDENEIFCINNTSLIYNSQNKYESKLLSKNTSMSEAEELLEKCLTSKKINNSPEINFGVFRTYNWLLTNDLSDKKLQWEKEVNNFDLKSFLKNKNNSYLNFLTGTHISENFNKKIIQIINSDFSEMKFEFPNIYYFMGYYYIELNLKNSSDENFKKIITSFMKCANFKEKQIVNYLDLDWNQKINDCNLALGDIYSGYYDTDIARYTDEAKRIKYYSKSSRAFSLYRLNIDNFSENSIGNTKNQKLITEIRQRITSENNKFNKLKLEERKEFFYKLKKGLIFEELTILHSLLGYYHFYRNDYFNLAKEIETLKNIPPLNKELHGESYYAFLMEDYYLLNAIYSLKKLNKNAEFLESNDTKKKEIIKKIVTKEMYYPDLSDTYAMLHFKKKNQSIGYFLNYVCLEISPDYTSCINRLALAYNDGHGTPKDQKKAMNLYHKAFDLKDSYAANNLGYNYLMGNDGNLVYKKAKFYLEKSIKWDPENNLPYNNLARLYIEGIAFERDIKKAIELLEKASSLGNFEANEKLGDIYSSGVHVDIDCEKALYFYTKNLDLIDLSLWIASVTNDDGISTRSALKIERIKNNKVCLEERDTGKNYALLIGNQNYKFFSELRTPINDVELIGKTLNKKFNYETKIIKNGTRKNILTAFNIIQRKLTYNDKLFIYYGGHGLYDEEINLGWWIPVDGEIENDINYISTFDIVKKLKKIKANKILLFADSCFSGAIFRGTDLVDSNDKTITKNKSDKTRLAITSGGLTPVLDSTSGSQNSIFAYSLYSILNKNKKIDAGEIFYKLKKSSKKNYEELSLNQNPEFATLPKAGHTGGNYYLTTK